MGEHIPVEQYVRTIAQANMYGCMYFTDMRGRPVQLLSVYGVPQWQLPGGNTDVGEDPWTTAVRECEEEIGRPFSGEQRLLVVTYSAAFRAWPAPKLGLIFDGGRLRDDEIAAIRLDPEEHSEFRVLPMEEWQKIMQPGEFARLAATQAARDSGRVAYLS